MNHTRPLPIMDEHFKVAVTIPLLVLGTVGNVLTMCVLQRSAFANKSFVVFLRSLALADFLTLWLGKATGEAFHGGGAIEYPSEVVKRLHLGSWVAISMVSSWTLMLISLERLFIVFKPHKAQALCTVRTAVIAVTATWLFMCLTMLIYCLVSMQPFQLGATQVIYYGVLYFYVPGAILTTCNVLIVLHLRRASTERKKMTPGRASNFKESTKITVMLIFNSSIFILLTLPDVIILTLWPFVPSARNLALYSFLYTLGRLNHAINFLLYCVSGNMFRQETKLMFMAALQPILVRCPTNSTGRSTISSSPRNTGTTDETTEDGSSHGLDMQPSVVVMNQAGSEKDGQSSLPV